MSKYYRLIKDTPAWKAGAILKKEEKTTTTSSNYGNGMTQTQYTDHKTYVYRPISDIWDAREDASPYTQDISLVENNPEWYERVYEVSILGKLRFLSREKAADAYDKVYRGEDDK